jgi:thiol-disulfide isomerase/thioredoxin
MNRSVPDALLLIAPGCPHCAAVLESLSTLVKQSEVGALEVVNVAVYPERAQDLGARSVPWLRIGDFELEGLHSLDELEQWAARAGSREGVVAYLQEQLAANRLARLEAMLAQRPDWLAGLVDLLADSRIDLKVRLGADALLEAVAEPEALRALQPQLEAMAADPEPRVRVDAAHYLAMTGSTSAARLLKTMLEDPDQSVREQAAEALEALEQDG